VGAAYVVPRAGAALAPADVIAWARERMSNYKVPRHVEIRAALPANDAGKVMKRRCAGTGGSGPHDRPSGRRTRSGADRHWGGRADAAAGALWELGRVEILATVRQSWPLATDLRRASRCGEAAPVRCCGITYRCYAKLILSGT
jgi:hypothetical protein